MAIVSPLLILVIWEAQFGDFNNGAQIIIDQYLSSAEDKWRRMNGLVMLLPHGYEGQGAEHSSARMERFLALCAELNMQVANCTTPANFFHLLRRQLKRPFRKPLIVFTPKSLLRHPKCISTIDEFTTGGFREVIDDVQANPANVQRVIFCTGKLYYELLEKKVHEKAEDVAIVRLEQLYPFPQKAITALIGRYSKATEYYWAQEEPEEHGCLDLSAPRIQKRTVEVYWSSRECGSGLPVHINTTTANNRRFSPQPFTVVSPKQAHIPNVYLLPKK